ncbi:MAG: hypothetical protein AAF135_13400 [Bacteroidota bacterium]
MKKQFLFFLLGSLGFLFWGCSSDGNWIEQDTLFVPEVGLNKIYQDGLFFTDFASIYGTPDGSKLWAVGSSGTILYSEGGQEWEQVSTPSFSDLFGIYGLRDGSKLWAVGYSGIYLGRVYKKHPKIASCEVGISVNPSKQKIRLKFQQPDSMFVIRDSMQVIALGITEDEYQSRQEGNRRWDTLAVMEQEGEPLWQGEFPGKQLPSLSEGEAYRIRIAMTQGRRSWDVDLKNKKIIGSSDTFEYRTSQGIYEKYILYLLIPFAYYIFILLWSLISPISFIHQTHKLEKAITSLPKSIQWIAVILHIFFPLSLFAYRARSLDAWISAHAPKIQERFDDETTVQARKSYVSLPVRLKDPLNGELVEKPDVRAIGKAFHPARTLIQVIGRGGSGKTTLTLQMARWAFDPEYKEQFGGIRRVPILVESDTQNLPTLVKEKLTAWLGEDPGEQLVKQLLKKQRLLIIVDALSERSLETQKHIQQVHGIASEVNALIISTRDDSFRFEAGGSQKIYPEPLSSDIILNYFVSLLRDAEDNPFKDPSDQLDFAKKIIELIQHKGAYLSVTPLLVKVAVDYVLNVYREHQVDISPKELIEEIPVSIPDMYNQYIRQTNPNNHGLDNAIGDDEMLQVVNCLGELSLGEDLIPSDFPLRKAEEKLKEVFPDLMNQGLDPIKRAELNGLILKNDTGGVTMLRFNFDPFAEFTGAFAKAEALGRDANNWKTYLKTLGKPTFDSASGFKAAFELIS